MAGKPLAPSSIYSFTSHSTVSPSEPQPGDKIDASLQQGWTFDQNTLNWVSTFLADDGHPRAGSITESMLAPVLWDGLLADAEVQLQPYVSAASASATAANSSKVAAAASAAAAASTAGGVSASASAAAASALAASGSASAALTARNTAVGAAGTSVNDANHAEDAAARAAISEQNAENWADYLAGPIAGMAPEDEHASVDDGRFSSAWWAIQAEQYGSSAADAADAAAAAEAAAAAAEAAAAAAAASAVTAAAEADSVYNEMKSTYYGAFPSAPALDPFGNPINEGDLYFDTTADAMRVWDGTQWAPFEGAAFLPVASDISIAPIPNVAGITVQTGMENIQANLEAHIADPDPHPQYLIADEVPPMHWPDGTLADPGGKFASEPTGLFLPAPGKPHLGANGVDMLAADNADGVRFGYSGAGSPISLQRGFTGNIGRLYMSTGSSTLVAANGFKIDATGANVAERTDGGYMGVTAVGGLIHAPFTGATVGGAPAFTTMFHSDPADGARFSYAGAGSQISLRRGSGNIGRMGLSASGNFIVVNGWKWDAAGNLSAERTEGGHVSVNATGAFAHLAFAGATVGANPGSLLATMFNSDPTDGVRFGYSGAGSQISVQRSGAGNIGRLVMNTTGLFLFASGWKQDAAGALIAERTSGGHIALSDNGGFYQSVFRGATVGFAPTFNTLIHSNPDDGVRFAYSGTGSQISLQRTGGTVGRIGSTTNATWYGQGVQLDAAGTGWIAEQVSGGIVSSGLGGAVANINCSMFVGATVSGAPAWHNMWNAMPDDGVRFAYAGAGSQISLQRAGTGNIGRMWMGTGGSLLIANGMRLDAAGAGIAETTTTGYIGLGGSACSVNFADGQTVGGASTGAVAALNVTKTTTTVQNLFQVQQLTGQTVSQIQLTRTNGSNAGQFYVDIPSNVVHVTSRSSDGSVLASYIQLPSLGTYGSMSVNGTKAGFAGIHFGGAGVTGTIHLMTNGDPLAGTFHIGFCNGAGVWPLMIAPGGHLTVPGNVTAFSDVRLKHNIRALDLIPLTRIAALPVIKFERDDVDMEQVGVSAQDIQELLPECVTEVLHNSKTNEKRLAVDYGRAALVLTLMLARELEKRT